MINEIIILPIFFIWTVTAASYYPVSYQKYNIDIPTTEPFPTCWQNSSRCNITNEKFSVLNFTKSLHFPFNPTLNHGQVIRTANLTLYTGFCGVQPIDSEVRLLIKINNYEFREVFYIDSSITCLSIQPYLIELDIEYWWYFFHYQNFTNLNTSDNEIQIYSLSQINLLVEKLHFNLELNLLDPSLQFAWPFIITNPWSLNSAFLFQMNSKYFSDKLLYTCAIEYQQYIINCKVDVIFVNDGEWWGDCDCPPPTQAFSLTPGVLVQSTVYLTPVFTPPFTIDTTKLNYRMYEQLGLSGVHPPESAPNNTIQIYMKGIIMALVGYISIKDDKNHQWVAKEVTSEYVSFVLQDLDYQGRVQLCFSVSMNNRDFTTTTCSPSNSFYYLGPTTPEIVPEPPVNLVDWLFKYWWSLFLIALVVISLVCSGFVKVSDYCRRMNNPDYDEYTYLYDVEIDSRVLIDMKEITLNKQIGKGSFSIVYVGTYRNEEIAVKILENISKKRSENFLKESTLMQSLDHPNLVKLKGLVINPRLCLITEYCCKGDVAQLVLDESYRIEPEHIKKIAIDACRGMAYLHACHVIHRDLKSSNLLIDKDWNIKVCDFGLARGFSAESGTMTSCGTPSHAAPEVLRRSHYTKKADVYSFGISLWELVCRKEPYDNMPGFRVIVSVATKNMRPKIPNTIEPHWVHLIRRCWSEIPDERPDFTELMDIFLYMNLPVPAQPFPWKEGASVTSFEPLKENSASEESSEDLPNPNIELSNSSESESEYPLVNTFPTPPHSPSLTKAPIIPFVISPKLPSSASSSSTEISAGSKGTKSDSLPLVSPRRKEDDGFKKTNSFNVFNLKVTKSKRGGSGQSQPVIMEKQSSKPKKSKKSSKKSTNISSKNESPRPRTDSQTENTPLLISPGINYSEKS